MFKINLKKPHGKVWYFVFTLVILTTLSCRDTSSTGKTEYFAGNERASNNTAVKIKKNGENSNLEKSQEITNSNSKNGSLKSVPNQCVTDNIARPKDAADNINVNELVQKPSTIEEFNEWLPFNNLQIARFKGKKDLGDYFRDGDFNGDGCWDIAMIVQGTEDKNGKVSMENFSVVTTVQNLRTGAVFQSGDVEKLPLSPSFASRIKPQQPIAVAVVLGGKDGWSWKYGGAGRTFLLYDSIYQGGKTKNVKEVTTVFGIVDKKQLDENEEDLLAQFPKEAAGACLITELDTSFSNLEYSIVSKRNFICFDGKKFFAKALPDTRSYPEY